MNVCYTLLLFFVSITQLVAQSGERQSFSIDEVLSAPYCQQLVGVGNRVVWVVNDRGMRNLYTAAFPNPVPRKLTNYTADDGQELGDIVLSPDGRWVAFVRGGEKNGKGVTPNPGSVIAQTEQVIYVLPTGAPAMPVRVGVGHKPVWAPQPAGEQSHRLLFGRDGQLYLARLADLTNQRIRKEPALLFTARGKQADYSFSPDGKRIVFTSYRGYHNLIGLYELGLNQVRWLAPGVDWDQFPVWSPDGRQVAFIRVPGQQHGELDNIQGGNPFAVWVTSAGPLADGQPDPGRMLWQSPADDGGFAQNYPPEPIRWTVTNRLLFFSEHQDWMHLYALDPTRPGQPLVDLTPGNAETEETTVSRDGKYLYYSSNLHDINRRHLWRVQLETGVREAITTVNSGRDEDSKGIETDPVLVESTAGQTLAYRSASWNQPTRIAYLTIGIQPETTLFPTELPASFPGTLLTEPQAVTFTAADGLVIHGQLFLPKKKVTNAPALVFMHGGPMRQMLLGWHYRGTYYANAYAMNQYLAAQGYVVLSVNYRAGIGYGRAFRRADKQGPRGAAEYQDVVAAGSYLKNRSDVNSTKIGLWGGSYGGYLTALGLARNSDLFACGVDLHGVHDWSWRGNMFSPGGGWGIGEAESKEAFASSPNASLDTWRSPCLFIHGDDDRNVAFAETVDLVQKLRARNVPTEILIFPDEVHSLLLHRNWLVTYRAMSKFFEKYLPVSR
ncbi:S9 family peptidase [Fibrella arboris]|uniref:S9 family peptidase n=1 Tax=Fibrella arboris TaxID=3242486 RepID=UPI003522CB19